MLQSRAELDEGFPQVGEGILTLTPLFPAGEPQLTQSSKSGHRATGGIETKASPSSQSIFLMGKRDKDETEEERAARKAAK